MQLCSYVAVWLCGYVAILLFVHTTRTPKDTKEHPTDIKKRLKDAKVFIGKIRQTNLAICLACVKLIIEFVWFIISLKWLIKAWGWFPMIFLSFLAIFWFRPNLGLWTPLSYAKALCKIQEKSNHFSKKWYVWKSEGLESWKMEMGVQHSSIFSNLIFLKTGHLPWN